MPLLVDTVVEEGEPCTDTAAMDLREFSKSLLKIVETIPPAPGREAQESPNVVEMPRRAA